MIDTALCSGAVALRICVLRAADFFSSLLRFISQGSSTTSIFTVTVQRSTFALVLYCNDSFKGCLTCVDSVCPLKDTENPIPGKGTMLPSSC